MPAVNPVKVMRVANSTVAEKLQRAIQGEFRGQAAQLEGVLSSLANIGLRGRDRALVIKEVHPPLTYNVRAGRYLPVDVVLERKGKQGKPVRFTLLTTAKDSLAKRIIELRKKLSHDALVAAKELRRQKQETRASQKALQLLA